MQLREVRTTAVIRLFTSVYLEECRERRAELLECLRRNLACPGLMAIHLLAEIEPKELPDDKKLTFELIDHRPTYSDFFAAINRIAAESDVSIVANSDIWFDKSIMAAELYLPATEVWALSRWQDCDDSPATLYDHKDSQDSWFFRGNVRAIVAEFPVGVPRCDNRLMAELAAAGYEVLNPAFSVRTYHRHAGDRTVYPTSGKNFVSPPYMYLSPHNLKGPAGTLWHKFRHPGIPLGWRIDRRRIRQWLPVRAVIRLQRMVAPDQR